MFISICFCNDGILRGAFNNQPLIPFDFIQQNSENTHKDDFSFWAKYWNNAVTFETGLTLSSFLSCLEPWSDFFSTLTGKDINSYIQEVRKPCDSTKQNYFKYIEISSEAIFDPILEHIEDLDKKDLFKALQNVSQKRLMQLSGLWNHTERTNVSGYRENIDKKYGLMFSRPEFYANTPLVLNDNKSVSFFNYSFNRYYEKDTPIFNDNVPCLIKDEICTSLIHKTYFTLRKVIEDFFSGLEHTPQEARDFEQMLMERSRKIMDADKLRSIQKEQEKNKENLIENNQADNVISIHKNTIEPSAVKINDNKTNITSANDSHHTPADSSKVKFNFSEGFISDLKSLGSKEQQLWNHLLELAPKSNTILKIGQVEKQEVPVNRLFGHAVLPENYIQPTPPKNL